jgi:hypothetical protein
MSHRNATPRSAGTATVVTLAALVTGFAAGIPAALYGITRDWDVTGRTVLLAAVVTGMAVDLLWMASSVRRLFRSRRQP